jgi:hypothetical protein
LNTNYRFLSWDNGKFTPASFNNLIFNRNHPSGPLVLRDEMKPFGTTLPTEVFQQIGADDKDKKPIFIGSILKFDYHPGDTDHMFHNSNLGKSIVNGIFDELLIIIIEKKSGFLGFDVETFFIKDGVALTKCKYYSDEDDPYVEEDDDGEIHSEISQEETFLRYLLGKGCISIVGHIKETPELIPVNQKNNEL